jgi:hypothetical protein
VKPTESVSKPKEPEEPKSVIEKSSMFTDPTQEFKANTETGNDYNKPEDERDYFKKTLEDRMGEYTNIDDFETYY